MCLLHKHPETNKVVQDDIVRARCFISMDEALLLGCATCKMEYCIRCITHMLGKGMIVEVLSEHEWGYLKCNVNLTTYRCADTEKFFTIAATTTLRKLVFGWIAVRNLDIDSLSWVSCISASLVKMCLHMTLHIVLMISILYIVHFYLCKCHELGVLNTLLCGLGLRQSFELHEKRLFLSVTLLECDIRVHR